MTQRGSNDIVAGRRKTNVVRWVASYHVCTSVPDILRIELELSAVLSPVAVIKPCEVPQRRVQGESWPVSKAVRGGRQPKLVYPILYCRDFGSSVVFDRGAVGVCVVIFRRWRPRRVSPTSDRHSRTTTSFAQTVHFVITVPIFWPLPICLVWKKTDHRAWPTRGRALYVRSALGGIPPRTFYRGLIVEYDLQRGCTGGRGGGNSSGGIGGHYQLT